ncbi:hypothetical protein, unlikely [Trypanosoma brucei brucei TREU927]|uniref:Uncharacterized protein n=1 Tax=Trypanosoma brucei brucei (strain 927/4 GUTat10.1) TaxID=185431 RepID=Q4GYZ2_TRYB2|nr:hypothetical protein, unlikely [Trypanosoma brucei brucei TREU927]CAJ16344.1 hypothetical protein, unlikely [Trypanosoma brucei brucei TREU927]
MSTHTHTHIYIYRCMLICLNYKKEKKMYSHERQGGCGEVPFVYLFFLIFFSFYCYRLDIYEYLSRRVHHCAGWELRRKKKKKKGKERPRTKRCCCVLEMTEEEDMRGCSRKKK